MGKLRYEQKLVTPGEAKDWLDNHNPRNRDVSPEVVNHYTRQMQAGGWVMIGDPVRIDTNGDLADGQHRLKAIVESDKPIEMLFVYGVDPEYQDFMDTGFKRSGKDQLKMAGVKNYSTTASIAGLLLRWNNNALVSKTYRPTVHEVKAFALDNEEYLQHINERLHFIRSQDKAIYGAIKKHVTGAVLYKGIMLNEEDATSFVDALATGANLEMGNPILSYRNHLHYRIQRNVKYRDTIDLAIMIRVWNAHRAGATLKSIIAPSALQKNHLEMK